MRAADPAHSGPAALNAAVLRRVKTACYFPLRSIVAVARPQLDGIAISQI